jgi:hypothetical protein
LSQGLSFEKHLPSPPRIHERLPSNIFKRRMNCRSALTLVNSRRNTYTDTHRRRRNTFHVKIDNDIKGSTSRIAKCSPREKQRDRGIRGLEDGLEECSIVGERLPLAGPRLEKQIRRDKAQKHEMRGISFNSRRRSLLGSTRKLSRP